MHYVLVCGQKAYSFIFFNLFGQFFLLLILKLFIRSFGDLSFKAEVKMLILCNNSSFLCIFSGTFRFILSGSSLSFSIPGELLPTGLDHPRLSC